MTSHHAKITITWVVIILASAIYTMSFFYTGFTGFAIIGTSVQITDDSSTNDSTGNVTFSQPDIGGFGNTYYSNPSFFSDFCANRIILQKNESIIVDVKTNNSFCVGIKDFVFSQATIFAQANAKIIQDIIQLDITLYPSKVKETIFPTTTANLGITLDNDETIYVQKMPVQSENSNLQNAANTQTSNARESDSLLRFSLDEKAFFAQQTPNETLSNLLEQIANVKNNLNSTLFLNDSQKNATGSAYLAQQVNIVELDDQNKVVNTSIISLADLPQYAFDGRTKKIALQWENQSDSWLVFTLQTNNLESLTTTENKTLEKYSKQFLLDTKDATLVPSQLSLLRTVLLGAVSIGFLSLHNIFLHKKYAHIVPHI